MINVQKCQLCVKVSSNIFETFSPDFVKTLDDY